MIRLGLADLSAQRSPIDIFVLDDDERRVRWFRKRFKGDRIETTDNPEKAKELIQIGKYDAIFLDHDLLPHHYKSNEHDDFRNTGFEIANWLAENKDIQPAAMIIVHTRNADGGLRMVEKLREGKRQVEYVPFPMLDIKIKKYWG